MQAQLAEAQAAPHLSISCSHLLTTASSGLKAALPYGLLHISKSALGSICYALACHCLGCLPLRGSACINAQARLTEAADAASSWRAELRAALLRRSGVPEPLEALLDCLIVSLDHALRQLHIRLKVI